MESITNRGWSNVYSTYDHKNLLKLRTFIYELADIFEKLKKFNNSMQQVRNL